MEIRVQLFFNGNQINYFKVTRSISIDTKFKSIEIKIKNIK